MLGRNDEPKMRPRRDTGSGSRNARLFSTLIPGLILAAAIALGGGTVGAVRMTEQPKFCASCHEMTPYHDAWQKGAHSDVTCTACHVDPGTVAQYSHKLVAMKEVYAHFTSDVRFPKEEKADIPDKRCLTCHEDLPERTASGFAHARHVKESKSGCVSCHSDVGHKVTAQALAKAGVLDIESEEPKPSDGATGTHVATNCSSCHDVSKSDSCSKCHKPKHVARGTCSTCHTAGKQWAFAHPDQKAQCATCHERPKNHLKGDCASCHEPKTPFAKTTYNHKNKDCASCHAQKTGHRATTAACSSCHDKPGDTWAFAHPASADCATCHAKPAQHYGTNCRLCHSVGTPFAQTKFKHTSTNCSSCHRPPSEHYSGKCSSCHKTSVAFAATKFTHPSSQSCQSCHKGPRGHRTSSCTSCHKAAGRSWAFSHPSSNSCGSCHKAPSNHYGGSCSGCHKAGRSFSSAQFKHPSTGSPHSSSSFACAKCHPSSPPKVGCTCHGGGRPSDDD